MKKVILRKSLGIAWILTLLFTLGASPSHAYQQELKQMATDLAARIHATKNSRVTVVDFVDLDKKPTKLGKFLAQQLQSALAVPEHRLVVVDQNHLSQLLDQIEKLNEGLLDPATGQQLGKLAGTEVLIIGTVMPSSMTIRLDAQAIDLETAKVITGESSKMPRIGLLARLSAEPMEEKPEVASGSGGGGAQVGSVVPAVTQSPRSPTRSLRDQEVVFELNGCSLSGNAMTCALTVTSERRDRWLAISPKSRAWTVRGDEYAPGDVVIANSRWSQGDCAAKQILEDVPTRLTVTFPQFGDDAPVVERLRLTWKDEANCYNNDWRSLDFEKVALSAEAEPRSGGGRGDSSEGKGKARGGLRGFGGKLLDILEDKTIKVIEKETGEIVGEEEEDEKDKP